MNGPPRLWALSTIFWSVVGFGLPAHAEVRFVAVAEGFTVSVGMPDFATHGVPEESLQSGIAAAGQHIVIDELIPAGESFDAWSSLYAMKIEEGVDLSFEAYVSQLLSIYLNACDVSTDMIAVIAQEENYLRILIPCQSYKDDPSTGEVAVFDIRQQEDDFINIYQHWRGPAFSAQDTSGWPEGVVAGLKRFMANADGAIISAN